MALYRLSMRTISGGRNQICVAVAAYIAGGRLYFEDGFHTYNFAWRADVVHQELFRAFGRTREQLWNEAFSREARVDAVTAREVLVALPHELDDAQRRELAQALAQHLTRKYRVAVDLAIHAPGPLGDPRNHHAHLLMTRRVMTRAGLADTLEVWDDLRGRGPEELRGLRRSWAELENRALERAGRPERVDERSYVDQGIDRVPGVHLGRKLIELERSGTEPWLRKHNRRVAYYNRLGALLDVDVASYLRRSQNGDSTIQERQALAELALD